jgi:hypothetical protein
VAEERTAPTLAQNKHIHKALNDLHRHLVIYVPTKQDTLRPWLQYIYLQYMIKSVNYLDPCTRITVFTSTQKTHCATSRKVAGSIPDSVIGRFH